ncbi:MAG: hypothetical protein ACR2H2_08025 [Solirubrobacteraceae bacterium]
MSAQGVVAGRDERSRRRGLRPLDLADMLRREADQVAERLQRQSLRQTMRTKLGTEPRAVGGVGVDGTGRSAAHGHRRDRTRTDFS